MKGGGYRSFQESAAYDSGYRRALRDILTVCEDYSVALKHFRAIPEKGLALIREFAVNPDWLELVVLGDATIFLSGKERNKWIFGLKKRHDTEQGEIR